MKTSDDQSESRNTLRAIAISAVVALIASILGGAFSVGVNYLSVARHGTGLGLWFEPLLLLPTCAAVITIPVAAILCMRMRTRRWALCALTASVIWMIVIILSIRIASQVRMNGFERMAKRSQSLIDAIHAYETDRGQPPDQLSDLVPAYLPQVPSTGIGAYPEYRYELAGTTPSWFGYNLYGNPWVLWVNTPGGGINFDMFVYLPQHNYPEVDYGGFLVPVDDWAYVHE